MASASSPNLPGVFTPTEQFLALAWSPSWVEDLTQCPYRALGKRRLGLREPDTYNADPTAEGHGLWVHRWLARFWQTYRGDITDTATARAHLLAQGERELKQQAPLIRKLWQPRLGFMSDALLTEWQKHTTQDRRFLAAEADLTGTIGNVDDTPLRARADHIDDSPTGWWLVDYKTGGVPGIGKIRSGEKPQLLLEAWLAEQAGHQVAGVEYLQLKGHGSRPAKSTTHARDKLAAELAQTGPWVAALAQRYGVHQTFPAAPVYGGGLSPRGHCKTCALGGVCRWAETTPPEPAA